MKTDLSLFDRIMCAITFAEANEASTAKNFLGPASSEKKQGVRPGGKRQTPAGLFSRKQSA